MERASSPFKKLPIACLLVTRLQPGNADPEALPPFLLVLLVTRLQPGNADPEALPPFPLSLFEAEPLNMGSQAPAWEPADRRMRRVRRHRQFSRMATITLRRTLPYNKGGMLPGFDMI